MFESKERKVLQTPKRHQQKMYGALLKKKDFFFGQLTLLAFVRIDSSYLCLTDDSFSKITISSILVQRLTRNYSLKTKVIARHILEISRKRRI